MNEDLQDYSEAGQWSRPTLGSSLSGLDVCKIILRRISVAIKSKLRIIKSKLIKFWYKIMTLRILDVIRALRSYYNPERINLSVLSPDIIPEKIMGFHDLYYLFACHQANRAIIAQDFDEAAYLWKIITEKQPNKIFEIGRWLGGSTILICAAAAQYEGSVISVDLKTKTPEYAQDSLIEEHLQKLKLSNYKLYIASSFDFNPGGGINLAFIDGDHSYEAVKKDYHNVLNYLSEGGDIIFHDSCAARPFASKLDAIAKLMDEIKASNELVLVREVGSLTHFRYMGS